jgi:ethanolamine utilization protein EutN
MLIGKVIGDVVATQKAASHEGRKILVVQPLNLDGSDRGDVVLALDAVDAGVGDREDSPIDMAVVGVIDEIDMPDGTK